MESDIIARLRSLPLVRQSFLRDAIVSEAGAEIERLRAEVVTLRDALDIASDCINGLAEQQACPDDGYKPKLASIDAARRKR